ncbi:MAG TPA: DUF4194 domain-containing protein [Candidatus Eremiobacteraeota bacterium]|nr:MAG: hypothetical protein BWY64_01732 [bacterium ADurb.Bin363]HPZ07052.1 DUF4194 domain-containing protein [Candidatus Eremiobacteraeota bacterium]
MIDELYERLTNSEKEEFKRLLNLLLCRTFIIRDIYDPKEDMMKINPDYRFIERNFPLFLEYLDYAGWVIEKDNNYGVISLNNSYDYNRVKLNRNTTLILYILRLIFEEEREKLLLRNKVKTTTGEVIHKMLNIGLINKKPSGRDLMDSFKQLSNHNITAKIDGSWEDGNTGLIIYPSILFVVTNEKISRIYEIACIEESVEEADNDVTESEKIIRGCETI